MTKYLSIPAGKINGFNYQPGYSSCAFETWRCFDAGVWQKELSRGKELFPKMNAVRLWLSWNAWCRGPERFIDNVKRALDICDGLGLKAVLVIFNRWHDSMLDCDGIYIDHFVPKSSWLQKYGLPGMECVRNLAKTFADDSRILAWDLCNEPFAYSDDFPQRDEYIGYEQDWLRQVAALLNDGGITQPVGVGTYRQQCDPLVNDFVDVFMTHLYLWYPADKPVQELGQAEIDYFEEKVMIAAGYAQSVGKPIMTTETCWGSFDDAFRCKLIEHTVRLCKKHDMGVFAYALCESDFTDIHRPEQGRISPDIGHLEFIYRDGTLRPGHDIINQFFN